MDCFSVPLQMRPDLSAICDLTQGRKEELALSANNCDPSSFLSMKVCENNYRQYDISLLLT